MTPAPDDPPRDPLAAYVDGDPAAVRAAAPREPSAAQWDRAARAVRARLGAPSPARRPWRAAAIGLIAAALLAGVAVAVWVSTPRAPEVARPAPVAPAAQNEPEPDPLPVAAHDDVVIHRAPGEGWLPVGAVPLPAALAFASAGEVELDDPNPDWPSVVVSPGDVPMVFAAKPR
jgi:hypothetical protein